MTAAMHPAQAAWLETHCVEAIVIGGSAGALEVLRVALEGLPQNVSLPVVVVLHLPAKSSAQLPQTLQSVSRWPMKQAEDKEPLTGGCVYFAPPDYHLLIEQERYFSLSADSPENFSRPSIEVLFESARDAYGPHLLGVLLSGASSDGAAGLANIAAAGGCTVVQDPGSASASTMPLAALQLLEPTWRLEPAGIRALLQSLLPAPLADL